MRNSHVDLDLDLGLGERDRRINREYAGIGMDYTSSEDVVKSNRQ